MPSRAAAERELARVIVKFTEKESETKRVHFLGFTPEMLEHVLYRGQPLYQLPRRKAAPIPEAWRGITDGARKKTPSVGYHITDAENLRSIVAEGLTAGASKVGYPAAVWLVDGLYPLEHQNAIETLHPETVVLKVRIPRGPAYDDAEVREFTGVGGGVNDHIGAETAFAIPRSIPARDIEVVEKGTRKAVPLLAYMKLRRQQPRTP